MLDRAAGVGAPPAAALLATPEGEDTLIASVGADVDVGALEREIRAEVARKRREGVYSADLLMAVAADPVGDLMFALRDAAQFSIDAPVDSSVPIWAGSISFAKRIMARCLRWHTKWVLGQVHTFAAGAVATLNAVEVRLQDHDSRLDAVMAGSGPARNQIGPSSGWRFATHIEALHAVPGSVAVLQCGRGELLDRLAQSGIDCYGVEPSRELVTVCNARGLNAFEEGALAHLAAAAPRSLGGIIADIRDGHLETADLRELVSLAAAALADGGVLVLEADPASAALGETLMAASGFKDVWARQISSVRYEDRLVPLPKVRDADLQTVVAILNANLARIDAALFGPSRTAVLARR